MHAQTLTTGEFETLLGCLGPERDVAAALYESLRDRLAVHFEGRHCLPADIDSLVDETFNRVARKALAGETIRNIRAYTLGVARYVATEYQRRRVPASAFSDDNPRTINTLEEPGYYKEIRAECFEKCVARLTDKQMQTIRKYFDRKKGDPPIPNSVRVRKNEIVRKILRPCCRKCFENQVENRIPP